MSEIKTTIDFVLDGERRNEVSNIVSTLNGITETYTGSQVSDAFSNATLRSATIDLIKLVEGYEQTAADDINGFRTIGYGINLDQFGEGVTYNGSGVPQVNSTLAGILTNAGIDSADHVGIWEGTVALNNNQATALLDYFLDDKISTLETKLTENFFTPATGPDWSLGNHEFTAGELVSLLSLVYNTPSLVGVGIRSELYNDNSLGALNEILTKSNQLYGPLGVPNVGSSGIAARRLVEGAVFSGDIETQVPVSELQDLINWASDAFEQGIHPGTGAPVDSDVDTLKINIPDLDGNYAKDHPDLIQQMKEIQDNNDHIQFETNDLGPIRLNSIDEIQSGSGIADFAALRALPPNNWMEDRFITTSSGLQMFMSAHNDIIFLPQTTGSVSNNVPAYKLGISIGFGDGPMSPTTYSYYDSLGNLISGPATNTQFDFGTNFNGGASNSNPSGGQNWQNGEAIGGGNYSGTMPSSILNGNGFFNVMPSGIITDFFMPGTGSFLHNALDYFNLNNTVDRFYTALTNVGSSVLTGFTTGGILGASVSLFTSVLSNVMNWFRIDPLILDIDGDGVELISFSASNALFDIDNDGSKESTGWVSADDVILVHDINGDSIINNVTETLSQYYNNSTYADGLVALKSLDSNNDNIFNSSDTLFTTLKVWQDLDGDGETDTGELKTLSAVGISAISLARQMSSRQEIEGNPVLSESTMTINGNTHKVAAVDFTTNIIGYEWNEIAEGIEVVLENNTASTLVINSVEGASITISSLDINNVMGNIGDDTIIGDGDNNWIVGGTGSDTLSGGAGNDYLVIDSEDDMDNIDAGSGFDVVQVGGKNGVYVNLAAIHTEVIMGGDGGDTFISGSTTNVFMSGGAGDDALIGGSADDALSGNDGEDFLDGGLGDDVLRGHIGKDILIGNVGEDFLDGGLGDDTLYGGTGEDLLIGSGGNDTLYGGDNYDVAEYSGNYNEYEVAILSGGLVRITDKVTGRDGTDTLTDVEALNFKNVKEISLDLDAPLTVNDVVSVSGSSPYTILASSILANDIDYQGNVINLASILSVVGGTASINGSGNVVFTPDAEYQGVRSFKYKITDSESNAGAQVFDPASNAMAEIQGTVYLDEASHPDDQLFYSQWYLNDINVLPVWKDYTGKGVSIGVFEVQGIMDNTHLDLVNNLSQITLDADDHVDAHATLVAGVIAADRNGQGSVGVAYEATLTGYHEQLTANEDGYWSGTQAVDFYKFDIVNNSWGWTNPFTDNFQDFPDAEESIFKYAAGLGRDGLGTVMIFAGGNSREEGGSANANSWSNNEYVITVGGINKDADLASLELYQSPFSNPGSNILVSAPASQIQSTSLLLTNSNGSTFGNDYSLAEGTSYSAPIVSGVVALMLEANPNLGYRDIQEILAYSARIVEDENTVWQTNGAYNWNNGGLHFSHDYGFGNVDALAAVRLAETWHKQETSDNSSSPAAAYSSGTLNRVITDGGVITQTISVPSSSLAPIEFVKVTLDFTHPQVGDLVVKLLSPSGTESILLSRLEKDADDVNDRGHGSEDMTFTFGSWAHMGELSTGNWTLEISDAVTGAVGTLRSWSLDFTFEYPDRYEGDLPPANTTYVFTNEYLDLTNIARQTLDENSLSSIYEDDTLNVSAVTGNVNINLTPGSTSSTIAGKSLTISSDTYIDRLFTGDGNDTLTGNTENNLLYGGRGNDTISGGNGNDWLLGKSGNNSLTGGSGSDRFVIQKGDIGTTTVQDFNISQGDKIFITNYAEVDGYSDISLTQEGANVRITMAGDEEILLLGISTSALSSSNFSFDPDFSLRLLRLEEATYTNGNDNVWFGDVFSGAVMYGLDGSDILRGTFGDDTIYGGAGNDTLVGSYDDAPGWSNTTETFGGEDILYGEEGNDTLYGSGQKDTLIGGAGNDYMYGNKGNDILFLEGGMDHAYGNDGADDFVIRLATSANITAGSSSLMDVIGDFNPLMERIDLRVFANLSSMDDLVFEEISVNTPSPTPSLAVFVGGNPSATFGNTQYFTLIGVSSADDLNEANFIFNSNQLPDPFSDNFTVNEDSVLAFDTNDLLSNDADYEDEIPTFSKIVNGPEHGVLTVSELGEVLYTPDNNYSGSDEFTYEVVDSDGGTATSVVEINVNSINDAPISLMQQIIKVRTGVDLFFTPQFMDHDGDVLTYSLSMQDSSPLPSWLSFDPITRVMSAETPLVPEDLLLRFTAFDGTATVNHNFTLEVSTRVPVALADAFTGNEDTVITGNLLADNGNGEDSDLDNDVLVVQNGTFTTLQGGSVLVTSNGNFSYTPNAEFSGSDSFTYTVLDGNGGSAIGIVNLTINSTNDAPVITSNGGTGSASLNISENTAAVTTVVGSDVDASAALAYSITGGADSAKFSINSSTGVLTFMSAQNFESPTDAGANNVYDVQVQVSDGALTDVQNIAVTVTNVDETPVITSNGGGPTSSVNAAENGTAVTTVVATDVDASTTITYSISGGSDSAKFSINSTTGVLTFVSAPNYESPTDSGANNVYDVNVQASDGTLTDVQSIAVTVTNTNEVPVITSDSGGATASKNVAENTTAVTTVTATDVDASASLNYSISGGADSSKFTINSTTGVLAFVAAQNFESPTDAGSNNVYDVQVQVSDGTLTDTQDIAVTVTNVNETPVITSNGGGSTASVNTTENGTAVTTVVATDIDASTAITYSISGGADSSKFSINSSTGVLIFASAPNYESPTDTGLNNIYDVQVQASDGTLTDVQNIAVTVTNVNEAPVITSNGSGATASVGVTEGTTAVTTIVASDTDAGTTITYSIIGGADSAKFNINATTGALLFVSAPSFASPTDTGLNNVYDVQVQASDGTLTDIQDIAVTVNASSGIIMGTSAGETISGTSGNDIINALGGNDTLNGGDGNDLLNGGEGNDNINGGNGTDTAVYEDSGSSVTINLSLSTSQNTGGAGSDTLNSIENVIGSSYSDILTGASNVNIIDGGAGNDLIVGGIGDDTLIGGSGTDTVDYSSHSSSVNVNLSTGVSSGGGGNDTLATIESIIGSTQGDTLTGDGNANVLDGRTGHDILNGGGGNDTLQGKDANDTLSGDDGDDILEGGLGSDTLYGGNGSDQAYYGVASTNFIVYRNHADYLIIKDLGNTSDAFGYGGDKAYNDIESIVFSDVTLDLTSMTFTLNGLGWGSYTVTLTSGTAQPYQGYNARDIINGFAGSDTIYGNLGNDDLYGNAGTDALYGGDGDDNLYGGDANDTLDGGAGNDTIDGGAGTADVLTYSTASSGVNVNLTSGTVTGGAGSDTITNIEQVIGSAYVDLIVANAVANLINGGDGEDIIEGTNDSAADVFHGGNGFDTLSYANATALVSINSSHATGSSINTDTHTGFENFVGSAYNDSISGNTANNFIWGGAGNDTLRGGDGADTLYGEDGADLFVGGAGNDVFDGGNGTDHLYLNEGTTAATVNLALGTVSSSSDGSDTFTSIEQVTGTIYADNITGDAGNNILNGSSGNDTIEGGDGDDIISGANDTDTVVYANASSGVTVNLATTTSQNTIGAGNDTLSFMENLIASLYADTISGSSVANVIDGGAGNDTINGGDGNDTLIGGAGDDSLTGGNGTDTASYVSATSAVTVNLATTTAQNTGGAGTDTLATLEDLTGSAYNDTLTGNSSSNTISGGDGNDTVEGAGGNDILTGGNGTDTVSFAGAASAITFNLSTTTSQNTVGAGSDTVSGFENVTGSGYNDTLTGDASANVIIGGAGNDTISGGDGNDVLYGNSGLDIFTGGNGADSFVFESASAYSNIDTISDFSTASNDALNLVNLLSEYDPLTESITDFVQMTTSGSDTLLSVDRDGAGSTYGFTQIATMTGVTGLTDEAALVTSGNLIVS